MSSVTDTVTLTARRSSRFVAWVRAWRAGLVPFDEVADEIAADEEHLVADAPGTWTDVPLARRAARRWPSTAPDDIRLVLPAPGDPRGLPGPGDFSGAALLAGEAVVTAGLGFVPAGPQPHVRLRDDLRDGAVAGLPAGCGRARRVADDARRRRGRGGAGERAGGDDR